MYTLGPLFRQRWFWMLPSWLIITKSNLTGLPYLVYLSPLGRIRDLKYTSALASIFSWRYFVAAVVRRFSPDFAKLAKKYSKLQSNCCHHWSMASTICTDDNILENTGRIIVNLTPLISPPLPTIIRTATIKEKHTFNHLSGCCCMWKAIFALRYLGAAAISAAAIWLKWMKIRSSQNTGNQLFIFFFMEPDEFKIQKKKKKN